MAQILNTNSLEHRVSEVVEFLEKHFVTVIADSELIQRRSSNLPEPRVENNTSFYDITYEGYTERELNRFLIALPLEYKESSICAAMALHKMLGDIPLFYLEDKLIFPQVEWYVKNKETKEIVDMSNVLTYFGGPLCYPNPKKFISDTRDSGFYLSTTPLAEYSMRNSKLGGPVFKLFTNHTQKGKIFYGRDATEDTPLYLFYSLCDRSLVALNQPSAIQIAPRNIAVTVIDPYYKPGTRQNIKMIYLNNQEGTMKLPLLGEYII